jgi:hypothetical protein
MTSEIIAQLTRIAGALERIAGDQKQPKPPIGSTSLADLDAEIRRMPARMRKAILRSGAKHLSDITFENMLDVRNCGEVTATAICEWAESKRVAAGH